MSPANAAPKRASGAVSAEEKAGRRPEASRPDTGRPSRTPRMRRRNGPRGCGFGREEGRTPAGGEPSGHRTSSEASRRGRDRVRSACRTSPCERGVPLRAGPGTRDDGERRPSDAPDAPLARQPLAPWKGGSPHQPHPGTRVRRCRCSLPGLTGFTTWRCEGTDADRHRPCVSSRRRARISRAGARAPALHVHPRTIFLSYPSVGNRCEVACGGGAGRSGRLNLAHGQRIASTNGPLEHTSAPAGRQETSLGSTQGYFIVCIWCSDTP